MYEFLDQENGFIYGVTCSMMYMYYCNFVDFGDFFWSSMRYFFYREYIKNIN
jgi:hypothetical protein